MIDGEEAVYRVVEMTEVDGYSTVLLDEKGNPVSSTVDISDEVFEMVLTNRQDSPPPDGGKTPPPGDSTVTPPPSENRNTPSGTPEVPTQEKPPVPDGNLTPGTPSTPGTPATPGVPSTPGTVRRVGVPSGTAVSKATSTGDNNGMVLWIVLAVAASAAVTGAAIAIRRRRREDD